MAGDRAAGARESPHKVADAELEAGLTCANVQRLGLVGECPLFLRLFLRTVGVLGLPLPSLATLGRLLHSQDFSFLLCAQPGIQPHQSSVLRGPGDGWVEAIVQAACVLPTQMSEGSLSGCCCSCGDLGACLPPPEAQGADWGIKDINKGDATSIFLTTLPAR